MRTSVYIDGFNLYYRSLKDKPQYKWLNLVELAKQTLSADNQITKVRYFTARVTGRIDPDAPKRQQVYLDALSSVPEIEVHYGKFLVSPTWAHLPPPDLDPARPKAKPPFMPWPNVVRVLKTEEKGSDVNLATHLLHDAYRDTFDVAVVLTNDTDLVEPVRIVATELRKTVGLLTPVAQPSVSLKREASFVHHIRDQHLQAAQFPDEIRLANGRTIHRPPTWAVL